MVSAATGTSSFLTLFASEKHSDAVFTGLCLVLVSYIIFTLIFGKPTRSETCRVKIDLYPSHFTSYKTLGDKETELLRMLEEEEDSKYDYSSTIRVSGSPTTSAVNAKASFVITDPALPDNPIVYASEAFCRFTGYDKKDIENRNCRFLQGEKTNLEDVRLIRMAIEQRKEASVKLLNYKKDGSEFVNQFFITPLFGPDHTSLAYYVGVQKEIDEDNMEHANGFDGENPGYRCFFWL